MIYAEIAVDAPIGPEKTFSYSIPDGLELRPGHLVKVPFGPRSIQGVVMSLSTTSAVAQTRDVYDVAFLEPVVDEARLKLASWVSSYYMCSLFEALSPMLPQGGRVRGNTRLTLIEDVNDIASGQAYTPFQEKILTLLRSRPGVSQEQLVRRMGDGARSAIAALERRGVLTREPGSLEPSVKEKLRHVVTIAPGARDSANQWLHDASNRANRQKALAQALLDSQEPLDITSARKEYGAGAVKSLRERGWLNVKAVQVDRDPLEGRSFPPERPVTLTAPQTAIAEEIRRSLDDSSGQRDTYLLQGVTGSGKTEVYLNAAQHCLALGKRAIVLVPEIALTYQTIERFASRFPNDVAVLHSGLTAGERFDQWWKVRQGRYGVVVGSRSAVFAPQPDLGLIIIDEEHEWTYKQHDAVPRYHTREVAAEVTRLTGATLLLGSASPDLSSYHRGKRGTYKLRLLTDRIASIDNGLADAGTEPVVAPLASVQIVDMRSELREGNRDIFSRPLTAAMNDCLDSGQQMMLFINRRGSSAYLQCRSCGFSLRCRSCDVPMTYHKRAKRLMCHYCGTRRIPPDKCPQCLAYRLSFYGVGTEGIAEQLASKYPGVEVLRWDRDTATSPKAHEDILTRFRSGDARILVGTQMIAKGLHFPSVTLVGVVSADVGLNVPDYRAGERTFQLLCQVAGRAGRGTYEGKVILQTYQPDNYAIKAAASQDYQGFYDKEMAFRRDHSHPPYSRLIRLMHSDTNRAKAEGEAIRMAEVLRAGQDEWGLSDTDVLGPTPTWPAMLRGRYRWHIILRGPNPRSLLNKTTMPQGWVVDIDPVSLT
ncbi:MAG: primosomal protein N' [Chloroflexi bacterium]|nr:primosomal protein N' [Chloroflexota bacterium]MDA1226943.1 primosomal protein N' [Chloroflexota bacterium]